jgi:hypothetical protein
MFDLSLDRVQASAYASQNGWDAFMARLESLSGRPLELYSVSTDWTRDETIKVIKARGARGDLLVGLR